MLFEKIEEETILIHQRKLGWEALGRGGRGQEGGGGKNGQLEGETQPSGMTGGYLGILSP